MSNQRYPEEFKIEEVRDITERGLRVANVAEGLRPVSSQLVSPLPADSVEKVATSPCRWQNCSVSELGG
ncbi:hypothetical protein ACPTGM_33295, partial [Pseudomonas aeruginosa]